MELVVNKDFTVRGDLDSFIKNHLDSENEEVTIRGSREDLAAIGLSADSKVYKAVVSVE